MYTRSPRLLPALALCALALGWITPLHAGDDAALKIVDKAITAHGGPEQLGKYKASTAKITGTVRVMGMTIPFTGETASDGKDRQRVIIEIDAGGQQLQIASIFNKDRGWLKIGDLVMDMDKEKLAEAKEEAYTEWLTTLLPLKDKSLKLATTGDAMVKGRPALGIRVSHKDFEDVNVFFDKENHLLVKLEHRVKDEETGQEVTEETFFSKHQKDGARVPLKAVVERDGRQFVVAEISELRAAERLDDALFAKP